VADEILADDVRYHGPTSLTPTNVTDPEDIKAYVETYGRAFPDLQYTIDSIHEVDGTLVVRWSMAGTHESDLFGIESTGGVFAEDGIDIFEVEDGRIAEVWSAWDTLKMMQALDAVPDIVGQSAE
jgi:predicted ester cyclase